ncbi:MAG: GNAT family N-acetyltransferase, partial [Steroidobacteraceae bacterium]
MDRDLRTRVGRPDEADALTALIRRAKASWGYPPEWMQAWQAELSIGADFIARNRVIVASCDAAAVVGFYGLELRAAAAHLEHLWVEPQRMRQGVGSALLGMACREAREAGYAWLELVADPNAVGFYRRHGALKVG